MSDNYRSQLIGSEIKMPPGETPQGMLENIYQINKKMFEVNFAVFYEQFYTSGSNILFFTTFEKI